MKKIIQYLSILLICIIGISSASALDSRYGIYCEYGDYYFIYSGSSLDDVFNIDTNFNELGVLIETDRPGKPFSNVEEQQWLISKKIIWKWVETDKGELACPNNPFGTSLGASTAKECGEEGCYVDKVVSANESYTCEYNSKNSGTINISYTLNSEYINGKWDITYPDGSKKTLVGTATSGNVMPTSSCEDIYYDMNNNTIHASEVSNDNISNNLTLANLCRKYNDDSSNIEHFCSGSCTFKEMVCEGESDGYNRVTCGNLEDIPAALPIFTNNIMNIIKIAIPIILIILGMIDFAKAVISNDEKGMKESQNKFVKRLIGAVAIFLVVAIVQFVFAVVNTDDTNEMVSCIDCFLNGGCGTIDEISSSSEMSCYQCNTDTTKYVWTDGNPGTTNACLGGYHERTDLTEDTCHS